MTTHERSTSAFTLVEVMVSVALATLVLGAMMAIFYSTDKMGFYGELAGTLQEGALAMAILQKDLSQAVQSPGSRGSGAGESLTGAVLVLPGGFQLIRAEFRADGSMAGELVVYKKVETQGGNFRLKRVESRAGTSRFLPGTFHDVKFNVYRRSSGGPFMRVTFRLAVRDVEDAGAAAKGSETAILSSVTRVSGPPEIEASGDWSALRDLESIRFLSSGQMEAL